MRCKNKIAISLVVLVITVIVLCILATTVIIALNDTSVISDTSKIAFRSDMQSFIDAYDIYAAKKIVSDITYDRSKQNATYKEDEKLFNDILGEVPKKYQDGLKIIKGKLVYDTENDIEREIVESLGMIPDKMKIIAKLINCTSSNPATSVKYGASYTTTITANSGYTLEKVSVVMNGDDITDSVYDESSKTITIPSVTDRVIITATTDGNTCTVTYDLENVTSTNNTAEVNRGSGFKTTIEAITGHTLVNTVTVKMGGETITDIAYDSETGTITIPDVTGDIIISASANITMYSITDNLNDVTNSNGAKSIAYGSEYIATLTVKDGYKITNLKIMMGDEDVTNGAYTEETGVISIAEVRGAIVISGTSELKRYDVTNNINEVKNSNVATYVLHGSKYYAVLNPGAGYREKNVTITVGGTDVTDKSYNRLTGEITISSVTGDVVITAQREESYIGHYVKIGDKYGVIYADLYVDGGKEGKWGNSRGEYTISTVANPKAYRVGDELYKNRPVLEISGNTSGEDRFYIISLEDMSNPSNSNYFTWYVASYEIDNGITDYSKVTSDEFGMGKTNTETMIEKWNNGEYGTPDDSKDMWKAIQNDTVYNINNGWFVPSRGEWACFGDAFKITSSNRLASGLRTFYWASSLNDAYSADRINFGEGVIGSGLTNGDSVRVRLVRTF